MGTFVRIHEKGLVTIPARLRTKIGLSGGGLVEAKAVGGAIVLTPAGTGEYTPAQRKVIDARLAKARLDVKQGRVHGPFGVEEAVTFLKAEIKARKPARK